MNINVIIGILIPFIGTSMGAACVFFLKNEINDKLNGALLGLASGVMTAASIWSLLLPSLDMSEKWEGLHLFRQQQESLSEWLF